MADDKLEIDVEPVIGSAEMAALKKQFGFASEQGIQDAFDRLHQKKQQANVDKVFDEISGEGAKKRAAASSAALHGGIRAGTQVAGNLAAGNVKGAIGMAGPWGAAIAGGIGVFEQLTDTIKSFVAIANPEVVEFFEETLKDVSGVIGQLLTPVLQAMIPFVQLFGDFLASILPNADQFRLAMEPMGEIVTSLREALDPLIPLIQDKLTAAMVGLAFSIKVLAKAFEALSGVIGWIAGSKPGQTNFQSSRGAARRGPASYSGIAEAGRGLQLAGFSQANLKTKAYEAQIESAESLKSIDSKTKGTSDTPRAAGNN